MSKIHSYNIELFLNLITVVQESRSCIVSVTGDQQFIAKSSSLPEDAISASNCGSRSHPWRLQAPVGQRINVSLINFTPTVISRDDDVTCHQYGYVVERSNKKNVTLCPTAAVGGAKPQRESEIYSSESNTVDIVLLTGTNSHSYNFLIKINGKWFYVHELWSINASWIMCIISFFMCTVNFWE